MTTFLQLGVLVNEMADIKIMSVFFFWALIFCAFLVTFGLRPFLYPFGLGPSSIVGEKDVQSELSGSLGREKLAEPWLCSPTIPLSSPSLGSFCSLINFFFAVSLGFFAFFTHCVPGPRLGTWNVYFPKEEIGGSTPGETIAIKELHQLTALDNDLNSTIALPFFLDETIT